MERDCRGDTHESANAEAAWDEIRSLERLVAQLVVIPCIQTVLRFDLDCGRVNKAAVSLLA